jgi:amino acid transporter
LLVCLSLSVLKNKRDALRGQNILPWVGAAISIYLLYSSSPSDKIVGTIIVMAGIPIYLIMSRKTNLRKLPGVLKLEEENFRGNIQRQNAFLANFVRMVAGLIRRVRRKE